jgi:hypothetical protein
MVTAGCAKDLLPQRRSNLCNHKPEYAAAVIHQNGGEPDSLLPINSAMRRL